MVSGKKCEFVGFYVFTDGHHFLISHRYQNINVLM